MRIRAGAVLVENGKVALIERFRNGNHYFVFPGGGVDKGETPQEAAIREMKEETGPARAKNSPMLTRTTRLRESTSPSGCRL